MKRSGRLGRPAMFGLVKWWRLAVPALALVMAAGGWLAAGLLGTLVGTTPVHAEPGGNRQIDRKITITVTQLLRDGHLSRRPLDDAVSRRWLTNFLETLDPSKAYFTAQDVERFRRRENDLDNFANRGDISFAHEVFQVYLQRVDERVKLAQQLLEATHDFTVDESIVTDPDLLDYTRTDQEARERWRKRIKHDLLVLKADSTKAEDNKAEDNKAEDNKAEDNKTEDNKAEEALKRLKRRYRSFAKRMHQTSDDELLEMYLSAMSTSFDPHTTYMSPETLENFRIAFRLQLDGIGASLKYEDGYTIVAEIVPGGAADRDGRLKPGDRVVGVGQDDDGLIEDVVEMKLSDVVKRIRGERGTIVRLEVIAAGKTERTIYNITRDKIELKGSEARSEILEVGRKPTGQPYKVGVINLPSFYMDMQAAQSGKRDFKSTTRDCRKLLENFAKKDVDVVVMDLRNNGGGSLPEAINLTGLFIDQGPVVQVKDYEGNVDQHADEDPGMAWEGPLVVLTSKLSASASEIFAAAVQDYNRGLIIGDPATHGKGTVQSLLDLGRIRHRPGDRNPPEKLGALKLTMQQFYRPSGDSTQRRGVEADIQLPSIISNMDIGEADLDFAVEFDKEEPAQFQKTGYIDDPIRRRLRQLSQRRVLADLEFQKLQKRIDRFKQIKNRKKVTLNEAKYLAQRKELEDDQDEKQEEQTNAYNRPVVERDFYFEEVLKITLDYLQVVRLAQAN